MSLHRSGLPRWIRTSAPGCGTGRSSAVQAVTPVPSAQDNTSARSLPSSTGTSWAPAVGQAPALSGRAESPGSLGRQTQARETATCSSVCHGETRPSAGTVRLPQSPCPHRELRLVSRSPAQTVIFKQLTLPTQDGSTCAECRRRFKEKPNIETNQKGRPRKQGVPPLPWDQRQSPTGAGV